MTPRSIQALTIELAVAWYSWPSDPPSGRRMLPTMSGTTMAAAHAPIRWLSQRGQRALAPMKPRIVARMATGA